MFLRTVGSDVLAGALLLTASSSALGQACDSWRPVSGGPPARDYHAMAYDSSCGRVVLFGGLTGGPALGDTWVWDGRTWTDATPQAPRASPSARYGHAMAYDAARGRVVLFGGFGGDGTDIPLGDTWQFDCAQGTWTNVTPPGGPSLSPEARRLHAMAYDTNRAGVILFGGGDGPGTHADTWLWNGAAWAQLGPGASPPARRSHAMATDWGRRQVVLFGGEDGAGIPLADTWILQQQGWVRAADGPQRAGHSMAYDRQSAQVILHGGFQSDFLQDTWVWNGAAWSVCPDTLPPSRAVSAMSEAPSTWRVMFFGGDHNGSPLADAWGIANPCLADFNRDGALNSQDFFDFLNAFFTGCP